MELNHSSNPGHTMSKRVHTGVGDADKSGLTSIRLPPVSFYKYSEH